VTVATFSEPHCRLLYAIAIEPIIAKRNAEHGSGIGKTRWVVEGAIAWLHRCRRLKFRYDRLDFFLDLSLPSDAFPPSGLS
jgi:hypothetical protein